MPRSQSFGSVSTDGEFISQNADGALTVGWKQRQQDAMRNFQIIQLQANAAITADDYDGVILDLFSDADGYDNTVNTGNTTALFDTDEYKAGLAGTESDTMGNYSAYNQAVTTFTGAILKDGIFTQLETSPRSSSSTIRIDVEKVGVGIIATQTKTGLSTATIATFTFTRADYSEIFETGDTYIITATCTSGGDLYLDSAIPVFSGSKFTVTGGTMSTNHNIRQGVNIFTEILSTATIEIDLPALSGVTKTFLYTRNATEEEGSSMTYTLTDGVDTSAELTPNQENITDISAPTKLNINLDAGSSEGISTNGYVLFVW